VIEINKKKYLFSKRVEIIKLKIIIIKVQFDLKSRIILTIQPN
jgi:hypothetical protein